MLSFKHLNYYEHYEVMNIMSPKGVWMASVDLKDALFTVSVHKFHQTLFMFEWVQKFCKFLEILIYVDFH